MMTTLHTRRQALLVLMTLLTALPALARDLPYKEGADVKAEVSQALADAATSHRPVLLIFGANWCEDCRALDAALKKGRNAELMANEFKVVKIDVGNFDRNVDVVGRYGNPIKNGIPAAVILSADNKVLFTTQAGELADARRMDDEGIERFFRKAFEQAMRPGK
jgi:thioredoxin 1